MSSSNVPATIDLSLLPSENDVAFFEANGYWLGPKVVSDEQLQQLVAAMDDVYAGKSDTGREPWMGGWRDSGDATEIRKTDNAWWANDEIRELALSPLVGAIMAKLLRTDEVRLWHDQLLYKPGQGAAAASRAGNVGWHQDHGYWQCTTDDLATGWVAFQDTDLANGCMQVVPGSHKWGLLPESDFFNTDLDGMKQKLAEHVGHDIVTEPCTLKAGHLSFHHCLTIHGSGPNATDTPRRSLVMHMMPAGARYIAGTPNDNHMNAILMREQGGKDGDLFKGDLWPTLWSA